jgi:hypothetical protein
LEYFERYKIMDVLSKIDMILEKREQKEYEVIYNELHKLEPFKTILSKTDEAMWLGKAKKVLAGYGVKDWQIKMAIEDIRKANAKSRQIVFIDSSKLITQLIKNGDL